MDQINNLISGGAVTDVLFYVFAALTLLCGILVIANPFSRNPVTSAMFLVLTIISMSGLFLLLHAFFLAAVQILVYAGAVMVLFLFIIMLLNIQAEERRKINVIAYVGGGVVALAFVAELALVLEKFDAGKTSFPMLVLPAGQKSIDDVHNIGMTLFSTHNLPFQVIGALILVATIGVVVLSKRELK